MTQPGLPSSSSSQADLNRSQGPPTQGLDATSNPVTDTIFANPVLSTDTLRIEALPGNIRKAEHFIIFLKKVVMYLHYNLKSGQDVESTTR